MNKYFKIIMVLGILIISIFSIGCQESEYLKVKRSNINIDEQFDYCKSIDNVSIKCFNCYLPEYQLCTVGRNINGDVRCWC